jgi:hypothetical protein
MTPNQFRSLARCLGGVKPASQAREKGTWQTKRERALAKEEEKEEEQLIELALPSLLPGDFVG